MHLSEGDSMADRKTTFRSTNAACGTCGISQPHLVFIFPLAAGTNGCLNFIALFLEFANLALYQILQTRDLELLGSLNKKTLDS